MSPAYKIHLLLLITFLRVRICLQVLVCLLVLVILKILTFFSPFFSRGELFMLVVVTDRSTFYTFCSNFFCACKIPQDIVPSCQNTIRHGFRKLGPKPDSFLSYLFIDFILLPFLIHACNWKTYLLISNNAHFIKPCRSIVHL